MKRLAALGFALILLLAACGGSGKNAVAEEALTHQADLYAIDKIESTWHKASSTHDVNLMMTLWAPDATFNIGTNTLTGKAQIRKFFMQAGPFQPQNHWVSETPAFKLRATVSGDTGTLYFECVYVDLKTSKVAAVVGADQSVRRINGKWLITSSEAATPSLGP